eukprot:CAMPEP_0206219112 /NCGR_PEP_ID=MMETSP0047_2-20121206/4150_1 /ASSEMBLY_ACC=CAM_ASM_000192 /TAXON_ID=195065 /ORGANISM="Chroomonas mesostigmatica_cf, Strain CCMP1168" /LENGTH=299 /DNA_ID=CAMNT_0053641643 /DNA_START=71 /DNA_END=967 /DNA_ORIENTATION=-
MKGNEEGGQDVAKAMQDAVEFLTLHRAVDLVVEKRPIVISESMPLCDALKFLASGWVRACPVKNATGSIIGTLDMRDSCAFLLEMHKTQPVADPTHAKTNRLIDYIALHSGQGSKHTLRDLAVMRPFRTFPPDTTLLELARALSRGCHIVGITDGPAETAGLSKVVTQGMLFKVIHEALSKIQLRARQIMNKPVLSIRFDSKACKAFEMMVNKSLSGLAVVDEDGIIIHNTSTSDLKTLITAKDIDDLSLDMSIEDFLVKLRAGNAGARTRVPVSVCKKDEDVSTIISKLMKTGYHRVW